MIGSDVFAVVLLVVGAWGALRALEGLCAKGASRWDWLVFIVFACAMLFGGLVLMNRAIAAVSR